MDVSQSLRLSMIIAGFLTVVMEYLALRFLLGLVGIPIILALPFLFVFWLIQWIVGPYLVGRNAFEVKPGDPYYGWLYDMVAQLAYAAGFKRPPRVFVADEPFPNAFAYGNYITGKRVAITIPLINIATREELRAVIAHELGHIRHNDVEIGLALGLIPTAIGYLSWMLINSGWLLLGLAMSEDELMAALISLAVGAFLYAVTFFLQIFVLWFNRLRESYADYHAYQLLGQSSSHLATALAKIVIYMQRVRIDPFTGIVVTANRVKIDTNEPYQLVREWLNQKTSFFMDFLSTHPHPAKRVQMINRLLMREGFSL